MLPPPPPEKIKVIIADDHSLIRTGLVQTLKPNQRVVKISEAINGKEVINYLCNEFYDLIFLDIRMKVMDGYATARHVTQKFPSVKMIALSVNDDAESVHKMINAGCSGYLTKDTDGYELNAVINAVMNGEIYIDPELNKDYEAYKNQIPPIESFMLTPREIDIIKLIALGKENLTIKDALILGFNNLTKIRKRIYEKIGADNIADVTRFAIRYKLIDA